MDARETYIKRRLTSQIQHASRLAKSRRDFRAIALNIPDIVVTIQSYIIIISECIGLETNVLLERIPTCPVGILDTTNHALGYSFMEGTSEMSSTDADHVLAAIFLQCVPEEALFEALKSRYLSDVEYPMKPHPDAERFIRNMTIYKLRQPLTLAIGQRHSGHSVSFGNMTRAFLMIRAYIIVLSSTLGVSVRHIRRMLDITNDEIERSIIKAIDQHAITAPLELVVETLLDSMIDMLMVKDATRHHYRLPVSNK